MAITRRQFITRTGLLAAGSFLGPGMVRNPLLAKALAQAIGDRYLVVAYLDGGNDWLNSVTPFDNGGGDLRSSYEAVRDTGSGGLQLSPAELLLPARPFLDPNTGAQLGFHPGLAGLSDLYGAGQVAIVQGCGYPNPDLSHAVSTSIWESGDPLGSAGGGSGWLGRYLAAIYGSADIPAVSVRNSVAGELRQSSTSVLSVRRLARFGFPADEDVPEDEAARRQAVAALLDEANTNASSVMRYLGTTGTATLVSTESYPPLHSAYRSARPAWNDAYQGLGSGMARDFREVAKIIHGVANGAPDVEARFFEVRNGGYDTHSDQGGAEAGSRHGELHREFADALKLFYADIADMQPGLEDKVVTLVWSEFARRVFQNSNGSDHGSQGGLAVIGGAVNGGVYGNHPNIAPSALNEDGNTPYSQTAGDFRSTDFRDVFGTVLKHWLNLADPTQVFPLDSGDAGHFWTVPDFDLPLFL